MLQRQRILFNCKKGYIFTLILGQKSIMAANISMATKKMLDKEIMSYVCFLLFLLKLKIKDICKMKY